MTSKEETPQSGATFDTTTHNACLAAAPNLVLVVMLGTGTEGQFLPYTTNTAPSSFRVPSAQRPRKDAGLASACRIQGGIDAWKKAGGPFLH